MKKNERVIRRIYRGKRRNRNSGFMSWWLRIRVIKVNRGRWRLERISGLSKWRELDLFWMEGG